MHRKAQQLKPLSMEVTELACGCVGEVNVKSTETDGVPDAERYKLDQLSCSGCACCFSLISPPVKSASRKARRNADGKQRSP
jgi:TPP-dependent indolepyruvate ferredoxin oxidoreductase alpha subunit